MRVLIIRLSSIGDIILTTAVLKELKEKYPNIIVDFLVMDRFKDAIVGSKYVDNLIVFKKSENDGFFNLIKFGKELNKNRYDYVFDLHSKMRSKIISKNIDAKLYRYRKRSFLKTLLVKARLIKYKVDDTIIKNYFGAFKDFELEYKGEILDFPFSDLDLKRVEELYNIEGAIVIAPGASKNTKQWIPEYFGKLIKMLKNRYKRDIYIIGGKNEFELCEKIKRYSENCGENLAGKLSLKESGALLSKSLFLVTNDSGPFHIARGVSTPTFVIFGPTSPEMFEYDDRNMLVYKNVECSPCSLHGDSKCPKGDFRCMREITPEHVYNLIEKNYKN